MKKLFVDKNEGVAEIVERIISDEEVDLILVIPKNSRLRESVSNFHLMRREAAASGKNIFVESVDDEVLALSKSANIAATHSFFEGEHKSSPLLDIVPRGPKPKKEEESKVSVQPDRSRKEKEEKPPAVLYEKEKGSVGAVAEQKTGAEKIVGKFNIGEFQKISAGAAERKHAIFRATFLIGVPILILGAIFLVVSNFFNKADVTISFAKIPWSYEHAFSADKSVSGIDFNNNILPGWVVSDSKNTVQLYAASSKKAVSEKAQGTITIYNAYSSERQTLVAATRFVTPDDKIFRITAGIVVPGAQIKNGKIIPSSIEAKVVADQPGAEYNFGPVSRLTIPGFKGSPRYDGFYGELKNGTNGGFVGEKAVPTADDVAKAKDKTTAVLRNNLDSSFAAAYPADCKILDGAKQFNVTKLKVDENTNADGNFSVFGEANILVLCFRETGEKSLKSFLLAAAAKNNPSMIFDSLNVEYSQIKVDFKNGKETFFIAASGALKPDFSPDDFKSKVLGQKVGDARSAISALPNLAAAKISLWPIWLWRIPSNPDHVKITVD